MTDLESRLTRRALLGAAVVVVAGCRSARHAAAPDADAAAAAAARAGELALLSAYAEGTPDHAAHLSHLRALDGTVSSPDATRTPGGTPGYTDVGSSVSVLQAAATRARAGATAAAFASIAASHAVLAARRP